MCTWGLGGPGPCPCRRASLRHITAHSEPGKICPHRAAWAAAHHHKWDKPEKHNSHSSHWGFIFVLFSFLKVLPIHFTLETSDEAVHFLWKRKEKSYKSASPWHPNCSLGHALALQYIVWPEDGGLFPNLFQKFQVFEERSKNLEKWLLSNNTKREIIIHLGI